DTAGGGVDQDPFSRPERGQVVQAVVGGQVDHRRPGGLGEAPARRDLGDQAAVGDGDGAGAEEHPHDAVPGAQVVDVGADLQDDAGPFTADPADVLDHS